MKKIIMATLAALAVSAAAFADSYNPFHEMYKAQAHKEMRNGVAQYNFMLIDESAEPVSNVTLTYVNHDNKVLTAKADAKGKVHLEFRHPNFLQLVSMNVGGVEYRVIGDDVSDDVSYKDISKGEVEYYVIQTHKANKAAYIYDAD